jgi:hypothetical protein
MVSHKEKELTVEERLQEYERKLRNELTLAMGQSVPVGRAISPDPFFPVLVEKPAEEFAVLSAGQ